MLFNELAAIDRLDRELVPLYVHYVDDHIARLAAVGRDDLAHAFCDWREQLIAGPAIGGRCATNLRDRIVLAGADHGC